MNSASDTAKRDTHLNFAEQTVTAAYASHAEAEAAVRRLVEQGVPRDAISMLGRNFETHGDIQGFYYPAAKDRPKPHPLDGLEEGAWVGGVFGLLAGAAGFFVLPVTGAMIVLGPLTEMMVGAISGAGVGAGVGALTQALFAAGIPMEQARSYQNKLQSGGFLVAVHGNEAMPARRILEDTAHPRLQAILP